LCDGEQMTIFGDILRPVLSASCVQHISFQTCIVNLHQGHTMCRSMADILLAREIVGSPSISRTNI